MFKFIKMLAVVFAVSLVFAAPAMAQEGEAGAAAAQPLIVIPNFVGAGLIVLGAAFGIGRLAAASVESMARQPEVAGTIQISMIIAAALIEGFTFGALFLGS